MNLDSIVNLLKDQKNTGYPSKNKSKGWVGALVAGLLVVITVAILGFKAWRQGKKLSKLLQERDVAAEDTRMAAADASMGPDIAKAEEAAQRVVESRERLRDIETKRAELAREHNETVQKIQDITSWDGVDSYRRR